MVRKDFFNKMGSQNNTTLMLRYKKPFNFKPTLSFMKFRAIKGVELVTENSYRRTFRTENSSGFFTVTDNQKQSALELGIGCDDIKCYMEIYNRVRLMFDLDTNFTVINKKFAADKLLSKGMRNGHVPRMPIAFNSFEFVVRAILGQQITVKAATTLAARVAEKAGIKSDASFAERLNYFFPTPAELIQLDIDQLGITKTRQNTIKTVTQAILDQTVKLTPNQSFDTFQKDFSALKGIGDWTVNYVAMRGLGMVDSFPSSDLGVIKALAVDGVAPPQKDILTLAEQWRPYRAYAALCLWNS
ncbi:DNA-3-methyladenine glycosylase 2 family protein [bacterium]|nr:DNA-3-methyladenine glycosylase 2 family protein [bacterium]